MDIVHICHCRSGDVEIEGLLIPDFPLRFRSLKKKNRFASGN